MGSDLGQGQFQFQFASEKDIQKVLDDRPYHFAHWMIILQRWEPTTEKSFPSQIPFWIQVQGIPLHLWSEETFKSIADDIGHYECCEITSSAAKMRVHIDGLQPLITSSMVEFENGDEVEASLVYDRLEKHCVNCLRLDHEAKECNVIPPKPVIPATLESNVAARGSQISKDLNPVQTYVVKESAKVRTEERRDLRNTSRRSPQGFEKHQNFHTSSDRLNRSTSNWEYPHRYKSYQADHKSSSNVSRSYHSSQHRHWEHSR